MLSRSRADVFSHSQDHEQTCSEPLLDHLRTQEGRFQSYQRARLFSAVRKKVIRMKVIHSSRPRIVSGCRRTVGLERRRPSELYPLEI